MSLPQMTKRERVIATARFQETDRVPLYDILQNDAIIEHYSSRKLDYDDGVRTVGLAVGRALDMTRMVAAPAQPGEYIREDGIRWRQERWTGWIVERPFHDVATLSEWVKTRIPEANARRFGPADAEQLHRYIEARWADFAEGDPTGRRDPAVLVIESGVGLEWLYHVAGMELFTYLLMDDPALVEEWLEAVSAAERRRAEAVAEAHHIPIALTYTDIAHKTGTMFSPEWLREHWIPKLKRLNDIWHDRGCLCLFHSDGNLWDVMDDLVAAGIDGLNPIEVLAGMTVGEVRRRHPNLFLAGGIDVSQLLALGTPDEVRAACGQAIHDTAGRGYFMGSSTELHWDVKLENAVAMVDAAQQGTPI